MDPRGQSWMFLRRNKSLVRILILDHTANNPVFILLTGVQAKIMHVIKINILLIMQSASRMVMYWILETAYRISN